MDTSGLSTYPKIADWAVDIALFTESADTFFFMFNTNSTTDTSGVGTRIAMPSILPANFGRTNPIALAAPVLVGIIERFAARARLKSLCVLSNNCWSPV